MANVNDSRNLSEEVRKEKERLRDSDIPEKDREIIQQFIAYREGRVSRNTLKIDMGNLRRAAKNNHKDSLLELNSGSDVDRIISNLPRVRSAGTMNGYNRALRQFFKWVSDEPQYDTYEWVDNVEDYDTDNGNSKRLKAEEYLTGEEVTALIEAATHPREEALIEFLADTGARINVVTNLRRQDIDIDGSRPTYRPNPNAQDGYKGIQIKRYPIHYSERPLSIWLNRNHPDKHPDAPAFPVKIGYDKSDRENMAMHPQTAFDTLRGLAEEAGIDESRVHPHAFRHAAVRRMKTDPDFNFDWETVKLRTAWSDRAFESMKELYGALEESEQLDYFFNRAGRETGDGDTGEPEFRECPTCGEMNRRTATYCQQCGKSLDAKLKEAEDKKEEIDDPKVRGIVDALIEEAKNNPEKFT